MKHYYRNLLESCEEGPLTGFRQKTGKHKAGMLGDSISSILPSGQVNGVSLVLINNTIVGRSFLVPNIWSPHNSVLRDSGLDPEDSSRAKKSQTRKK